MQAPTVTFDINMEGEFVVAKVALTWKVSPTEIIGLLTDLIKGIFTKKTVTEKSATGQTNEGNGCTSFYDVVYQFSVAAIPLTDMEPYK